MRNTQLVQKRNEQITAMFDNLLKDKYTHGPLPTRITCVTHELAATFFLSTKRVKAIIATK